MSGISSIGGSGSDVFQRLQQAFKTSSSLSVGGNSGASDSPLSAMRSNLQASGVDVQQMDSLQDKIQSAISSAVQDAENSGGTTDMRKLIESTVDKTLKDNGIDPDKFKQQMKSAMGGMMPPGIGGKSSNTTSLELDALFGDNSSTSSTTASNSKSSNKNDQTSTQLSQSLQDWLYKLLGNQSGKDSQLGLLLDTTVA